MVASYLAEFFDGITFEHISRIHNTDADEFTQIASGAQLLEGKLGQEIPVLRQLYPTLVNQQVLRRDNVIRTRVMSLPSLLDRQDLIDVCAVKAIPDDWRKPIMQYLDNPNGKHSHKTRVHATNYVTYQNELYRKSDDGLLLLCLGPQEGAQAITEVYEGVCRAHQSTPYYPQANGQAEASNKVLISILEKIIKERLGMWHLKLNEALWAYRTSL
ncbi:uncharacterized protein [Malus domestica]|uniref:uncharacterized protein n=1 Tax=Malus domestica TaxID=3750 RepID=UPI003975E6B2